MLSSTSAFLSCEVCETFKNTASGGLYEKPALKNFAMFTRRKYLVISVLWKRCSWWLIELSKWRVFILINISRKKKMLLAELAVLFWRIIWGIFFWSWIFLVNNNWTEHTKLRLSTLKCHCREISSVLPKI